MKKKYFFKLLIFLFLVLNITACSNSNSEEPEQPGAQTIVAAAVSLIFLNKDGEDLLNPATPNYFPMKDINLYYLVDGKKIAAEEYAQVGGDRGKALTKERKPYRLAVYTYFNIQDAIETKTDGLKIGKSTTLLELNDKITDTIKTEWHYNEKNGNTIVQKFWYNGILHENIFETIEIKK